MDLRALFLSVFLSIFLGYGLGFFVYLRFGKPHVQDFLTQYQDLIVAYKKMDRLTSSAMTALQTTGVESRNNKTITRDLEQDLFQGLTDANPELFAIAEELFPDFLAGVKENPQQGLAMLKRYIPLLQSLGIIGAKTKTPEIQFEY
jgi:hypothetical protein